MSAQLCVNIPPAPRRYTQPRLRIHTIGKNGTALHWTSKTVSAPNNTLHIMPPQIYYSHRLLGAGEMPPNISLKDFFFAIRWNHHLVSLKCSTMHFTILSCASSMSKNQNGFRPGHTQTQTNTHTPTRKQKEEVQQIKNKDDSQQKNNRKDRGKQKKRKIHSEQSQ